LSGDTETTRDYRGGGARQRESRHSRNTPKQLIRCDNQRPVYGVSAAEVVSVCLPRGRVAEPHGLPWARLRLSHGFPDGRDGLAVRNALIFFPFSMVFSIGARLMASMANFPALTRSGLRTPFGWWAAIISEMFAV